VEQIDFLSCLHKSTNRDYVERVARGDKAHCAAVAKRFGEEYWDGDRKYGYGGYRYDGRWGPVAADVIEHYGLKAGDRMLDVGCGKAHLIYEMRAALPGLDVRGLDLSAYALAHAKQEVRDCLDEGDARHLPYPDNAFDLVISLTTLHNLPIDGLGQAIAEIERVKRRSSYVVVESYRTEEEKANLLNWQLTCECFFTPAEWEWLFGHFGYTGDYSFIYFE
jgi:hypothetical protein